MATAIFLCVAGAPRRILWMHDCFWSSGARRCDAAVLANAVEPSAHAPRVAVCGFVSDLAPANHSDGVDTACHHRGPAAARDGIWPRDRIFLRREHPGSDDWRASR